MKTTQIKFSKIALYRFLKTHYKPIRFELKNGLGGFPCNYSELICNFHASELEKYGTSLIWKHNSITGSKIVITVKSLVSFDPNK